MHNGKKKSQNSVPFLLKLTKFKAVFGKWNQTIILGGLKTKKITWSMFQVSSKSYTALFVYPSC